MNRIVAVVLLATLSFFAGPSTSAAGPITLSIAPPHQAATVGGTVDVDIVVSDLHDVVPAEIVSAFDLIVTYDSGVLFPSNVAFGLDLGDPSLFEAVTSTDLTFVGEVSLKETSLLDDPTLDALQADRVTLATISFDVVGTGASPLAFSFGALQGVFGLNALPLDFDIAQAVVEVPGQNLPEAPTLVLLGIALAALGHARRGALTAAPSRPASAATRAAAPRAR